MSCIVTRASFFSVLLLASSVIALPSAARGQNLPEARTRSITPFLHTSIGMSDPAPGNSMGIGGAVTYDWATGLAVEGEVSHLFDLAGDTPAVDWSITNISVNGLYRFDTKYVTPYVTLGLGLEHGSYDVEPDGEGADLSSTEVAINLGGGVTRTLNDNWAARADLRYFHSNDTAPNYWRLYGGLTLRIR